MLKAFKKLISQTPELNDVQQNVFDTVQELKSIDFCNVYEIGEASGLANNTNTIVNSPIQIPSGSYLLKLSAYFTVAFSSAPNNVLCYLNLFRQGSPSVFINGEQFEKVGGGTSPFVIKIERDYALETKGELFGVSARVNSSGGTVTALSVASVQVQTFRRAI